MSNVAIFNPNWCSAPGETIRDILIDRKVSVESFASRINQSIAFVNLLLAGDARITGEIAKELELHLGATQKFWLKRDVEYLTTKEKVEQMEALEWAKKLPIDTMSQWGIAIEGKDKMKIGLDFFDVRTVPEWRSRYIQPVKAVRFRTSKSFDTEPIATATWLRYGELVAMNMDLKEFDADLFQKTLFDVKHLTRVKSPSVFIPRLVKALSDCGVALVIARAPRGCRASGAAKYLSPKKALLMLSFRHLSDDHFWFSFYHEAGHILLHEHNHTYIDAFSKNQTISQEENDANFFAGEILIPQRLHNELKNLKRNKRSIVEFAQRVGVSPGILIGQMQYHEIISHQYLNGYKRRYDINEIEKSTARIEII